MRGPLDGPYALTVGDLARVDVYVPDDQIEEASLVLLVDEVDEVDECLDDDRPPIRDPHRAARCVGAALLLLVPVRRPLALRHRCAGTCSHAG